MLYLPFSILKLLGSIAGPLAIAGVITIVVTKISNAGAYKEQVKIVAKINERTRISVEQERTSNKFLNKKNSELDTALSEFKVKEVERKLELEKLPKSEEGTICPIDCKFPALE